MPRFAFADFPLGNPCGRPGDRAMQDEIVGTAVGLFETAQRPRTTLRLPHRWPSDDWRADYLAVRDEDLAALRRKGDERRALRETLRAEGRVRDG